MAATVTGMLGSVESVLNVETCLVCVYHCMALSWLLVQSLLEPHTIARLLHICESVAKCFPTPFSGCRWKLGNIG